MIFVEYSVFSDVYFVSTGCTFNYFCVSVVLLIFSVISFVRSLVRSTKHTTHKIPSPHRISTLRQLTLPVYTYPSQSIPHCTK